MSQEARCPLCANVSQEVEEDIFYQCRECEAFFRPKSLYPTKDEEEKRYREHNNDVNDPRYQQFVSPIVNAVKDHFVTSECGLDFGAGTGPVASKLLIDAGYSMSLYDPFFHNNLQMLNNSYDFIICCEVIEHFHNPHREFRRLRELLNPKGRLYCMTHLYDSSVNFKEWYYRRDETHVFIYTEKTMRWIKNEFNFKDVTIEKRLITFSL